VFARFQIRAPYLSFFLAVFFPLQRLLPTSTFPRLRFLDSVPFLFVKLFLFLTPLLFSRLCLFFTIYHRHNPREASRFKRDRTAQVNSSDSFKNMPTGIKPETPDITEAERTAVLEALTQPIVRLFTDRKRQNTFFVNGDDV
jgi:hypothetical protein